MKEKKTKMIDDVVLDNAFLKISSFEFFFYIFFASTSMFECLFNLDHGGAVSPVTTVRCTSRHDTFIQFFWITFQVRNKMEVLSNNSSVLIDEVNRNFFSESLLMLHINE